MDRRRADDPDPGDRFRGLYISDPQVDALLDAPRGPLVPAPPSAASAAMLGELEQAAEAGEAAGREVRLRRLARTFGLEPLDVELLLIALAPDLDPRFERLYGYLHDDVSRRRASVGLALELCDPEGGLAAGAARARLGPLAPLVEGGLLLVEDTDRPTLTRSLRVPDRVTAHLLGDDTPDALLASLVATTREADIGDVEVLARALGAGVTLAYLRERAGASGASLARTALARTGRPTVELDLTRLTPTDDPVAIAAAAGREARLLGGGMVVGPVEALAERGAAVAVRAFAERPCPVVLIGDRGWDPAWARETPLIARRGRPHGGHAPRPVARSARRRRPARLRPRGGDPRLPARRRTRSSAPRAPRGAAADAEARPTTVADVSAGARAQNAAGLERLARRIEPHVTWDDLVLPPVVGRAAPRAHRAGAPP